jgi:dipeptidyl-peptidase-3
MKGLKTILMMTMALGIISSALQAGKEKKTGKDDFKFLTEQFADARILRYQVPGFETLSLKQKKLIYFLSQAALCGRDITYDQNYKHNLLIRKTLEAIYGHYDGDRTAKEFGKFVVYLKRVWFSNGIHHHYSTEKFFPDFSEAYFATLVKGTRKGLPLGPDQPLDAFIAELTPLMFSHEIAPKRVSLDDSKDLVLHSAANFYEGVTQKEVEQYYEELKAAARNNGKDDRISWGLNSKVVKTDGRVTDKVYKLGGLYSPAIEQIIAWLEKAMECAETPEQKVSIGKLIEYYRTGDLTTWDDYNIAWVKDQTALVDFVNGFIEVYGDPLAMKGSWESIVNFKDVEASKRTVLLSDNAQYFEDNSPVSPEFKKKEVKGVTAKVIVTAQLGGESDPTTPIGINLPNANWIRKEHGSKSVTMDNITYAYDQAAQGNGFLEEFAASKEEVDRVKTYGYLAGNLTTDLHECLGHGSGQLNPGVSADALKNYHSAVEESRADLFALYYIMDPIMIKLGLIKDKAVAEAEYDNYIRNGLMTQLVRIQPGKDIEQAHMRDRALISHWIYEKGKEQKVIEKVVRKGKTAFRINDYAAMHRLVGELLKEVQRITSEGDFKAARELVETYGVKVDQELHKEVLERYAKLNISPYAGFINPVYDAVMKDGTISDVTISYPDDFAGQMMDYSGRFSFLQER